MLSKLAQRIDAAATWRRMGALLIAYVALVSALTFAEGRIKERSGGLGVPDLMQGFTAAELYARLEAFGPEGRRIYVLAELVDLVYPLVYATFFAFLLALGARAMLGARRPALLCLLPCAAMLCDYLENATFFVVLFAWPARLEPVAAMGGIFNTLKWLLFAPTLALSVLCLVGAWIQALRRWTSRPA